MVTVFTDVLTEGWIGGRSGGGGSGGGSPPGDSGWRWGGERGDAPVVPGPPLRLRPGPPLGLHDPGLPSSSPSSTPPPSPSRGPWRWLGLLAIFVTRAEGLNTIEPHRDRDPGGIVGERRHREGGLHHPPGQGILHPGGGWWSGAGEAPPHHHRTVTTVLEPPPHGAEDRPGAPISGLPLAISVNGGIIVATALTLIVFRGCFSLVEEGRLRAAQRLGLGGTSGGAPLDATGVETA